MATPRSKAVMDQLHILVPFVSLNELRALTPSSLWRQPTIIVVFNNQAAPQLTQFWFTLIKYHWKAIVQTNRLPFWRKWFKWSNETLGYVYGEMYRQFAQMYPNGPGRSSVEDVKETPVDMVPEIYIPVMENAILDEFTVDYTTIFDHLDILYLYSRIARYVNKLGGVRLIIQSVALFENVRNHSGWLPGRMIPGSLEITTQDKQQEYRIGAIVHFSMPAKTSYDRFALTRFMMFCMLFSLQREERFNISVKGSNGRFSMIQEVDRSVVLDNKLVFDKKFQIYMRVYMTEWSIHTFVK